MKRQAPIIGTIDGGKVELDIVILHVVIPKSDAKEFPIGRHVELRLVKRGSET